LLWPFWRSKVGFEKVSILEMLFSKEILTRVCIIYFKIYVIIFQDIAIVQREREKEKKKKKRKWKRIRVKLHKSL
jgi:hypothetical protein